MRNRVFHIVFTLWLPMLVTLLMASCVKRELEIRPEPTEGSAEIVLDRSALPTQPRLLRYLFYDENGALASKVTGITGGYKVKLPPGRYHLIVHNEDARQVDYRGTDSYETAEVFALPLVEARSTLPRIADLSCILEPEETYGTGSCIESEWLVIEPGQTTRATIRPTAYTRQVELRFVVKGDIEVQSFSGTLSGITSGIFLATGEANHSEACALRFTADAVKQDGRSRTSVFTAKLSVFSLLTTMESPAGTNSIDVVLTDIGGGVLNTTADITASLQEIIADNGGSIPVEIPIELLFEVVSVGNITATVRPWDDSGTGGGKPNWD